MLDEMSSLLASVQEIVISRPLRSVVSVLKSKRDSDFSVAPNLLIELSQALFGLSSILLELPIIETMVVASSKIDVSVPEAKL
jgi:hypothetical protein